jgi:hypothetical protein
MRAILMLGAFVMVAPLMVPLATASAQTTVLIRMDTVTGRRDSVVEQRRAFVRDTARVACGERTARA